MAEQQSYQQLARNVLRGDHRPGCGASRVVFSTHEEEVSYESRLVTPTGKVVERTPLKKKGRLMVMVAWCQECGVERRIEGY